MLTQRLESQEDPHKVVITLLSKSLNRSSAHLSGNDHFSLEVPSLNGQESLDGDEDRQR